MYRTLSVFFGPPCRVRFFVPQPHVYTLQSMFSKELCVGLCFQPLLVVDISEIGSGPTSSHKLRFNTAVSELSSRWLGCSVKQTGFWSWEPTFHDVTFSWMEMCPTKDCLLTSVIIGRALSLCIGACVCTCKHVFDSCLMLDYVRVINFCIMMLLLYYYYYYYYYVCVSLSDPRGPGGHGPQTSEEILYFAKKTQILWQLANSSGYANANNCSVSGVLPPNQGLCRWTPLGLSLPQDPHYKFVFTTWPPKLWPWICQCCIFTEATRHTIYSIYN